MYHPFYFQSPVSSWKRSMSWSSSSRLNAPAGRVLRPWLSKYFYCCCSFFSFPFCSFSWWCPIQSFLIIHPFLSFFSYFFLSFYFLCLFFTFPMFMFSFPFLSLTVLAIQYPVISFPMSFPYFTLLSFLILPFLLSLPFPVLPSHILLFHSVTLFPCSSLLQFPAISFLFFSSYLCLSCSH